MRTILQCYYAETNSVLQSFMIYFTYSITELPFCEVRVIHTLSHLSVCNIAKYWNLQKIQPFRKRHPFIGFRIIIVREPLGQMYLPRVTGQLPLQVLMQFKPHQHQLYRWCNKRCWLLCFLLLSDRLFYGVSLDSLSFYVLAHWAVILDKFLLMPRQHSCAQKDANLILVLW